MSARHLLGRMTQLGIRLSVTQAGDLQIDAPRHVVTPELRSELKANKHTLIALCRDRQCTPSTEVKAPPHFDPLGVTEQLPLDRQSSTSRSHEWFAEHGWVLALGVTDLPAVPFPLDGAKTVVDSAKFLATLQVDVARGPDGPRARTSAVQHDAGLLRRRKNGKR